MLKHSFKLSLDISTGFVSSTYYFILFIHCILIVLNCIAHSCSLLFCKKLRSQLLNALLDIHLDLFALAMVA